MKDFLKIKNVLSASALIGLTSALMTFSGQSAAQEKRDLTKYPCFSYTKACGKMPPPPIQKVEWSGSVGDVDKGRDLAFTSAKGNCLACHEINGGTQGGTIGPSLVDYGKKSLPIGYTYQRIWDIRVYNKDAHMPIFGTNEILTDEEIRHIMAFLYSLR